MGENVFNVGYFSYPDKNQGETAYHEQERISRLESQLDYSNPKIVQALYNKIIDGKVFKSPEGTLYLIHLQEYLLEHKKELDKPVNMIPVNLSDDKTVLLDKIRRLESERSKAYKTIQVNKRKTDNLVYKIIIAAMALIIISMLAVSLLSGGPTILNYRNEIQNEYSEWEQRLNEKERELNEREKQLDNEEH